MVIKGTWMKADFCPECAKAEKARADAHAQKLGYLTYKDLQMAQQAQGQGNQQGHQQGHASGSGYH
jgi:hypothetical protein